MEVDEKVRLEGGWDKRDVHRKQNKEENLQIGREKMSGSSTQNSKKYEQACEYLHYYFSGNYELNQQKLVEMLSKKSLQELEIIRKTYIALFGCDLLHAISGKQRSNALCRVAYLCLSEPKARDAEILRNALSGGSFNLTTVIEIICTRSSSDLHGVKERYRTFYQSDIEKDVSIKVSGSFSEILVAVCKSSHYYKYNADMGMALCDAKTLYEAVESGKAIDRRTIISLLSRRNTTQIKAILLSYKQLYGHEFSKSIKNPSRCGQFGRELRVVIRCIQNPEKFFAKQLRMKNADARELLMRVVITRSGNDVRGINRALVAKRAGSLENLVRREFSSSSRCSLINEAVAATLLELIKA